MKQQSSVGLNLIRIASLYLMVGLTLGLVMALSQDHSLVTVHSQRHRPKRRPECV